ncbi:MAG: sigma-70 family RNA polymerase sigma factor [Planctomycetes bacterium]|nr:sigma-70 family RNA polymerase sigma factor [Planctomycetota bacterium]
MPETPRHGMRDQDAAGTTRPLSLSVTKQDITLLLQAPTPQSINALLELVYDQLRSAAQLQIRGERHAGAGQTLSATALVHEAYLKLVGPRDIPWQSRGHFYAAAAEAMRRVLIDRARAKYGRSETTPRARQVALTLSGLEGIASDEAAEEGLLPLDASVERLARVDPQAAAVVRLRFYTGLNLEQTALALGVSERTAKRDWSFARAWLRDDLSKPQE